MTCRTLSADDTGRRIFGIAIEPDARLAMSLKPNARVLALRLVNAAATLIGSRPQSCWFSCAGAHVAPPSPLLLAALALVVIVGTDVTFIGGYRPFDDGDDGLDLLRRLRAGCSKRLSRGDALGVLEAPRRSYGFTPGMRYFRALEYLALRRQLPRLSTLYAGAAATWSIAWRRVSSGRIGRSLSCFSLSLTPLGVVFGTTYAHYAIWAARGYADPLGAMLFLSALLLLAAAPAALLRRPRHAGLLGRAADGRRRHHASQSRARRRRAAGRRRPRGAVAASDRAGSRRSASASRRSSFTLWHNWYFGGVIVPLSDNVTAANVYMMSPADYRDALGELMRLDLSGAHLARAATQVMDLLAGPSGQWVFAPLHLAATLIVLRVMCAARFEPMLRLTALAAIALSPIGLIYSVTVRYNLVLWLLTALDHARLDQG